jgi:hypothetical protein
LVFFALSSVVLVVVLLVLIVGAAGCGLLLGRSLRESGRASASPSASFKLRCLASWG